MAATKILTFHTNACFLYAVATATTLTFHTLVFQIICCGSNNTTHFSYSACFPYAVAATTPLIFHTMLAFHMLWQQQHHSLFVQCLFSIWCGSNNTTHFSYSACFPYAVAAITPLTFHTILVFHTLWPQQYHLIFIQRLFSICCGNGNKANFSYKFTTLIFHMLWQWQQLTFRALWGPCARWGCPGPPPWTPRSPPHGWAPPGSWSETAGPPCGRLAPCYHCNIATNLSLLKGHGFKSLQEWQENFTL